ncbi:MAG: DUF4258 domain-containing protein [Burkholderiaceae bacterium]|nr:DUF4258 domain-containing protein [Burkholderiaceae bacterium]
MHIARFGLPVVLTEHARLSMAERQLDASLVLEIIDTGTLKEACKATIGFTSTLTPVKTICFAYRP